MEDSMIVSPVNSKGDALASARYILGILEVAVDDTAFYAVTIPSGIGVRGIMAKARSGGSWSLSTTAVGTTSFTVAGTLSIDLIGLGNETIFYAKGAASDTIEVMLLG